LFQYLNFVSLGPSWSQLFATLDPIFVRPDQDRKKGRKKERKKEEEIRTDEKRLLMKSQIIKLGRILYAEGQWNKAKGRKVHEKKDRKIRGLS
jgi:hypothetical protein